MGTIPKIKSFAELRNLISRNQGILSRENKNVITEIIDEMEKSGGVTDGNREQLKKLMQRLANQNGIKVSGK